MNERKIDALIRKSLEKGTTTAVTSKEQMWADIQQRLDKMDQQSEKKLPTKKNQNSWSKQKRWLSLTAAIAIVFLGTFLLTMEQGQAVIVKIREWLAPEKSIEQELEGNKEKTDVQLHQTEEQKAPKESKFAIYVDETRYHVVKNNGVFRITMNLPAKYPEVYMDITQQVGVTPATVIKKLQQSIPASFTHIGEIKQVNSPVVGYTFRADQGNKQWNDEIIIYYVVSNGQQGSFIIKQKYFLEASEGHGARFDHMLKEFRVITEK